MSSLPLDGASTGMLIADIARLMRRNMNRRVQHLGLTSEQWRALFHLSRCEGINQATLADRLEVQPISLARILDKLQDSQLIERRPSPTDRRAFELFLTPTAQPMLEELSKYGREARNQALSGLSEDDQQLLAGLLETVKNNLSNAEEQPDEQACTRSTAL